VTLGTGSTGTERVKSPNVRIYDCSAAGAISANFSNFSNTDSKYSSVIKWGTIHLIEIVKHELSSSCFSSGGQFAKSDTLEEQ
jgi:hypothetical protein